MRKIFIAFFALLFMTHPAIADPAMVKIYQKGDWGALLKSANGAPMAVHFWGVTCPACIKEMPQWQNFIARNKNSKVVFIQVEDVSLGMVSKMLKKFSLENANNYSITSLFDERLRFEVDPTWHGETPVTFLIDSNGRFTRHTGLTNFRSLQSWFKDFS